MAVKKFSLSLSMMPHMRFIKSRGELIVRAADRFIDLQKILHQTNQSDQHYSITQARVFQTNRHESATNNARKLISKALNYKLSK